MSGQPTGPWQYQATVMEGPLDQDRLKEIARTGYQHSDWKPLREAQRTGVAEASSLEDPWERMDTPLLEPSGPITTLVINPAITQRER